MSRYIYILIVLLAGTANATNYYVSPWGNNSNGSSWANAWTHPNSTNAGMDGNDTVFIAPGTYDSTYIRPDAGNVYACSTLSAMDSLKKVTRLRGTMPLPTGTWTSLGSNIYKWSVVIPDRWNSYRTKDSLGWVILMRDGVMQHSLDAASGGEDKSGLNAAMEYIKDGRHTGDSLYIYSTTDPNGSTWRYGQAPVVEFTNGNQDGVSFLGLTLEEGYQGVMLIGSSDISDRPDSMTVSHCIIQNAALIMSGGNLGLIFASGGDASTTLAQWGRFNRFTADSFDYAWCPATDLAGGSAIDAYSQREITIDSCYFGPNLKAGGLMFKNGGNQRANMCYGVVIAHNIFDGGDKAAIWFAQMMDSTLVYGNLFKNQPYCGIDIHTTGSTAWSVGRMKIKNNTFWNSGGSVAAVMLTQRMYDSTGTNEFKYNVMFDTATVQRQIIFHVQSETGAQTPALETQWDIDSNYYYFGSGSFATAFISGSGCTGTNFAAWQSCGFDANGSATTNPNFDESQTATLVGLARTSSSAEMNQTYGGKTWTRFGAWQPSAACADTLVAPVFQSPANGATGQANSVILDWSDSTQVGTVDLYDLQVDNNSDFSSVTFSSATAWSKDTVTATLALYTTYYWRIRGRSDCDTSAWSGYRSFTMQDSCIVISSLPYTASTADTCYCLQDRRMASTGTGITATGRNVRILNRYGTRDTLEFGTDGGDNYRGVKATADNFKIDGLYVWHNPSGVNDSAKNNICLYIENVDTAKIWRTQVRPAGLNGRGLQNNSGGFDIDVWRLKHDSTAVRSFESRCQHLGNVMLFDPEPEHDDGNYFVKVHACSVTNAPHNIVAFTGGPTYHPLIYCDSNYFVPDARNDWYSYPDGQSNACYSSGDPFAIDVLGMGPGSRIRNNYLGYGTLNEGGQGMLLQNLMGSSGDSIVISGNYTVSSSGPNDIHGSGLCASQYFRYVPGDANTGSQYVAIRDNYWETILDTDTSTTYRGRQGETWSLILSGGAPSSTNEADSFRHIDWTRNVVKLTVTGTRSGFLEGSAISWGARDSSTSPYNRNGYLASKYNHYSSPYCVVEIGNMRGTPGNGFLSIGDTIDQTIDDDSTYSFDRTSSYTSHSRHNRIINAIYSGYANDADIGFDTGGNTDNDTLGESISFWKTLTSVVTTCTDNTVVSGASYWVWDSYGDTVLTGTTGGDGVITGLVNYKCETYDKFPADGFVLADSAYNDFTIKAKKNDDSVQVTITVAAASLTQSDSLCFLTLAAGEESPMIMMRGISIRGVTIK